MDHVPDILSRYIEAYNAKDLPGLLACLTEDVVFENWSGGELGARCEGRDAFEALAGQSLHLFSERRQTVTNCIDAGQRVALKIAYRATIAADLPNGWKAGQVVSLTGSSFARLKDGRIAELIDLS